MGNRGRVVPSQDDRDTVTFLFNQKFSLLFLFLFDAHKVNAVEHRGGLS